MNWQVKTLEEVADFWLGKMLDQKKNKGKLRPYLANVNVRWGEFSFDNLREMRFEDHELEKYGLTFGDIVMCEGGEPGRCAIWKNQRPGIMIQKALHRIRPHQSLDSFFLYYVFLHYGQTGQFAPLFTGATINHLPREKLALLELEIPPLTTQRKIAGVLSAYDDLIENNTRRIAILEEMAQSLYREWFVNFRFPGHENARFIDSPLGKIPEGWKIDQLSEISTLTMGQSPSSEFYNEIGEGLPFHQGVTNFGDRYPTHVTYSTVNNRLAESYDILFSVRAPVGRLNIADTRLVVGRGVSAIRHKQNKQVFLFHQLKEKFKEEDSMGGGTIFKSVTKEDMQKIQLINPSPQLINKFEESVGGHFLLYNNLTKQNRLLRKTRDLLLPKLISGQLDVEELDIDTGETLAESET